MIYPLSLSASAPSTFPITLTQVKSVLRIQHTSFDTDITALYLPAAVSWAEVETKRAVASRSHRWSLGAFPCANDPIRLPAGKATAVASIVYIADGQTVTLRGPTSGSPIGDDFQEDLSADWGGLLMPVADATWPTNVDTDVPAPIVITFTAGWSDSTCPADVKLAMIRYIGEELDQCEDGDAELKNRLISGWRLR